jgi:hypothetical protein
MCNAVGKQKFMAEIMKIQFVHWMAISSSEDISTLCGLSQPSLSP